MIRVDDVAVAPGGTPLVQGVSFHVRPGEHVGLVGRNGTGKTTLLRAIVGEIGTDSGKITVRPDARLAWLPQQAVSGSVAPVWDEVASGMTRLHALKGEVDAAERAVAKDPAAAGRLAQATESFRLAGGYAMDQRIGEVLHGLGFAPDTWYRACDTFSGGWQMRIALARLLLSEPDIALLDEPTNHLDLEARSWLAGFLQSVRWAYLLVSHDRWLLEKVERIVEVRAGRCDVYSGNFSKFMAQKVERDEQLAKAREQQQHQIAHLERFVERFGAKATKAAQAKSKQKALDRIDRIEAPPPEAKHARIRLPEPPGGSMDAVTLDRVTLGWEPGVPILEGVELTLTRGHRIALLGPNGCGKSTILQAASGKLKPMAGRRSLGDRIRIGTFDQDLAQALPPEPTALDHLTMECPTLATERLRAVLGALGLPGDKAIRPIGSLSGGEKARVALALLVVRPCNVLLLDEPTNHLDAETVDVLVAALRDWAGAMLLVTHDRYVVEQVATHVARIRDGKLTLREGVLPEDFVRDLPRTGADKVVSAEAEAHLDRKKRQREIERAKRRVDEIQEILPKAEAAIVAIDEALIAAATDHVKAVALALDRAKAEGVVNGLYAEWESLEALAQ